jgi:hypothetical protein
MKARCRECGATVEAVEKETVDSWLATHMEAQHGSPLQRHASVLKDCAEMITSLGPYVPASFRPGLRDLRNRITDLIPQLKGE